MRLLVIIVLALVILAGAALLGARLMTRPALAVPEGEGSAERGAYVFAAAGCGECHTADAKDAVPLAGGRAIPTPFGTFYGPNITPDPEHGIGGWSTADFFRAMRLGVDRDGDDLFPAFPYASFTRLTDQDILDLKAYIFAQPPSSQPSPPHEVGFPFNVRLLIPFWKLLYLEPGPEAPLAGATEPVARGAYLVRAAGHCGECHTPRDALGGPREAFFLAGSPNGADNRRVPNITPHDSGIGGWSEREIADLLETGATPDFDFVGGAMGDVIAHSTSLLTNEDRRAIGAYLLFLPPLPDQSRPE